MTNRPSTRARHDWALIRAWYVALDPPRRYSDVARKFGVSVTSVRKYALRDDWADVAAQVDRDAAEKALRSAVKTRDQRVASLLRITDQLIDHFEDNLAKKAAEATFVDVERMAKLSELLLGEATDRISTAEVQQALVLVMAAGPELAAELVASGLKGDELVRAFRDRYPAVVQERIALAAGGAEQT